MFRDEHAGQLDGLFPDILTDMIEYACGKCDRPGQSSDYSILDREKTGKGTLAQKRNQKEALEDADEYTELTFPITAHNSVDYVSGLRYVALVQHPGLAFVVARTDINSIVKNLIMDLFKIWPILLINVLFMILVGFLVWVLVSSLNYLYLSILLSNILNKIVACGYFNLVSAIVHYTVHGNLTFL